MKKANSTTPPLRRRILYPVVASLIVMALLLGGCAMMQPKKPSVLTPTGRGTVVFLDKYEFTPPPGDWRLMKNLEGGDFELGFLKIEKGSFPSQTTFIYDDQPFGSSPDLEKRAEQYCTRFLFNTGMFPQIQKKEKTEIRGVPALAINLAGENPPRSEKALSKVYLVKRGDRIISFVCTQWRPLNGSFDPDGFARFETFVRSFTFLKPDFYDQLNEKIRKLKG